MVGYSYNSATTIAQVDTSSSASQYSNMWGLLLGKVTDNSSSLAACPAPLAL